MSNYLDPTACAIILAALVPMLIAWAIGGDRRDADLRGTYDAGTAEIVAHEK